MVLNALEDDGEKDEVVVVRAALEMRERDRKDWRSGVRSLDMVVWACAIALAFVGEEVGNTEVDRWS